MNWMLLLTCQLHLPAIQNHAFFVNVAPIVGAERAIIFEEASDGSLTQSQDYIVQPGDILVLPPGTIHCIKNNTFLDARTIQVHGGNLYSKNVNASMTNRSLWEWDTYTKILFSIEEAMHQSVVRMACSQNDVGIEAAAALMAKELKLWNSGKLPDNSETDDYDTSI